MCSESSKFVLEVYRDRALDFDSFATLVVQSARSEIEKSWDEALDVLVDHRVGVDGNQELIARTMHS